MEAFIVVLGCGAIWVTGFMVGYLVTSQPVDRPRLIQTIKRAKGRVPKEELNEDDKKANPFYD